MVMGKADPIRADIPEIVVGKIMKNKVKQKPGRLII
jgi:hypothetical protein